MTINQNKRQQRLVKKKKKRVAAKKSSSHFFGKKDILFGQVRSAALLPVVACYAPSAEQMETNGMGTIILARGTQSGELAVSIIMLDLFCLGAKNAMFRFMERSKLQQLLDGFSENENLESMEPACARKLIEDNVSYAEELGFKPHRDFAAARLLYGDIDADQCNLTFSFGYNGQPHYISGPHDSPTMVRQTINTLERKCGEGNYCFTVLSDQYDSSSHHRRIKTL